MYRRDDDKLHCRDGEQAEHFSASQGAEQAIARGWATLLWDRLRDFVVVPSSAGGNYYFELHSRSSEERSLCFSSLPARLLIPALWGLSRISRDGDAAKR
jgi:hypothetical protein